MGKRNEGVCKKQGQGTEKIIFFLHDLPKVRRNIRQELRGTFCANKLKMVYE